MVRLGGTLAIVWVTALDVAPPAPEPPHGRPPAVRVIQPGDAPDARALRPEPIAVPPDGRDRLGAGGVLLVGGVVLASLAGGMLVSSAPPERRLAAPVTTLALGGGAIVGGAVLLGYGHARLRGYRAWAAKRPPAAEPVPPAGRGMIGAGAALVVVGVATTVLGGWSWAAQVRYADDGVHSFPAQTQPPAVGLARAMVGVGVGSSLAGGFVLGYGARRNKRHHDWRRLEPTVAPRVAWLPGGVQLGVGGRF